MSFKDVFMQIYNSKFGRKEPKEPKALEPWPYPKSTDKREPVIEKKTAEVKSVPKAVAPAKKAPAKRKHAKIAVKK